MEAIDIDFDGDTSQVFRIGAASCAVPGAAAGLEAAHRSYGSLPWSRLFEPGLELARGGVELTRPQAYLHAILDLILRHTPEGRRTTAAVRGSWPAAGWCSDLGGTLEALA
jgi:gamma-glutamyltranspeptidase/glutathione hydrolase